MRTDLGEVMKRIAETYEPEISNASRDYLEVDIGKQAEKYGFSDLKDKYGDVSAVIPLKHAVPGLKVLIDGRTFVNYAQLESGIAVPEFIARETELPFQVYQPNDSMVLNFA
jgi:hypothetical protein